MNKACASILIFVALFALVGAEDFMRMPLDQGVLRMRNLASSSYKSQSFDSYSNLFGVQVNLSSTYLTATSRDNNTKTDMLIFLFSNITGFCTNCGSQFENFGCDNYNNCSADTTQSLPFQGPNYYITGGNPFNFSNLTIGADSTTAPWKLNSSALLYSNGPANTRSIYYSTGSSSTYSQNYFKNTSTYGFIGLGVGGNASKNFQTATPIFSVQVNSAGNGSLIFGKDTTYIDSSKTAMTLTTDTNWTMTSRNMSFGSVYTTADFYSSVIFDLQTPGILVPSANYDAIWAALYAKYKFVYNTTLGNSDFPMTYNGSLSDLPNLSLGLTNDKNITLPPGAYTRKLATNFYAILIGYTDRLQDYSNRVSTTYINYTVLGWPVFSQFYTVFELPTTGIPTVTMYPASTATSSSGSTSNSFSLKTLAIVAAVVLVVLVALSAVCKKKQDFTKSDLGVELRAARV